MAASFPYQAIPRLKLRRIVARRNAAVIKVRRLAKASNVANSADFERLIAEQLAAIENLNALIDELRGKAASRNPDERSSGSENSASRQDD